MADRYLIFDESGNLGSSGRYFVIACVDTGSYKSLQNFMRNKLRKVKKKYPQLGQKHAHEIKANEAFPAVRLHILESLCTKDVTVSYIVADLKHVKPSLLKHKNIFYNYLMKLLVSRLVTTSDPNLTVHIIYDNHSTKVGSVNSLDEYLTLGLLYERGVDLNLAFRRMDSDASDAYPVQVADYVANAVYLKYEYQKPEYYNKIAPILHDRVLFPPGRFGK